MGFLLFLFFLFVFFSILRNATRTANQKQVHLPPDFFGTHELPPGHVRQLSGEPGMISAPAMIPASRMGEESSSEVLLDETAHSHDLNLDAAVVVSLERSVPLMSLAPRPVPVRDVTLETEVDWEVEHARFHQRYVDARAPSLAAATGLLDELRDPASARRAVLMAEILGPPISLRGQH